MSAAFSAALDQGQRSRQVWAAAGSDNHASFCFQRADTQDEPAAGMWSTYRPCRQAAPVAVGVASLGFISVCDVLLGPGSQDGPAFRSVGRQGLVERKSGPR